MIEEEILYMKDNHGAMRVWAISADWLGEITIRYGQEGGAMQYQYEQVEENQSGRDLYDQVSLRMASRITVQNAKGYIASRDIAESRPRALNALGKPKPMLAHKFRDVKNIDYTDAIAQPKFDGNRCMIDCTMGISPYTRNGKVLEHLHHITDDLQDVSGWVLDGELYCHGYPLQTIVSWIKRRQPETRNIKYHLYDIVAPNLTYKERSEVIRGLPIGANISPVYGDPIDSHEALLARFREYRGQGYEGAMLRWGNAGYEDGKRSKSLLKLKEWESEEFLVIAIHASADGWAILECALPNFETFRVSAPGSIFAKTEVLQNKLEYVGKKITVEFAQYTKDGVPFHPVAINFRDEIQG